MEKQFKTEAIVSYPQKAIDAPTTKTWLLIHRDDQEAFRWLYRTYWERLVNFAFTYIADWDTCKEIVQILFVQLLKVKPRLNKNASLSSYLHVALRNRIYNYLRDQAVYKKHITLAVHLGQSCDNDVEESVSLRDLQREINIFLRSLPVKYREVYLLYERDHFPIKMISTLLRRPKDTVEKQVRRVLGLLREHLKHHKQNQ